MAGDAVAVIEASAEEPCEEQDPLSEHEWTMSAGWLAVVVALTLGACAAVGLLT